MKGKAYQYSNNVENIQLWMKSRSTMDEEPINYGEELINYG